MSQIVSKLAEDLELAQYVNRGASYTSHLGGLGGAGAGLLYTQGADQRGRGRQPRGAGVGGVRKWWTLTQHCGSYIVIDAVLHSGHGLDSRCN